MPRCALVGLAGLIGTLPAWADSGNPACVSTNGSNCQIGLTANPAGHGQTGPTQQPDPITYDFTNQQTLNAGNGAGAVDFATVAGDGGAANHDGMNGGTAGAGGGIGNSQAPVSIGPAVTVGGAGGVYVDIEGGLTSSYAGSTGLMRPRRAAAAMPARPAFSAPMPASAQRRHGRRGRRRLDRASRYADPGIQPWRDERPGPERQ